MNGFAYAPPGLTGAPVTDMRCPGFGWAGDHIGAATYEVEDAAGRCLYRGTDLELACDIHDHDPGAHLRRLAAAGAR
jgi:hypothetical protein